MKHFTLTLIFIIMMAGLGLPLQAQTTPSGPIIMNFSKEHYDHAVLSNNDQQLVAYCSPIWQKLKKCYHSIVTYDKRTNITSSCVLNLSSDYKRLVALDAGDSYFVAYSRYPKATEYEFSTTNIPKDCANDYTVTPRTELSLDIDRNGYVQSFVAESGDHTKHAIVLVGINKKQMADKFYFYVYDDAGHEVLSKVLAPEIYGDSFSVEDLAVTDDGDALLLMRTGTKDKTGHSSIHLLACTQEGGKSYVERTPFGEIQSMRLLVLKNGNYFVGGYCAEEQEKPTSEYFSCIFNKKLGNFEPAKHYKLSENQKPKHEFMLLYFTRYYTHCAAIHELDNGEVVMIGEHRAMVIETGQGTTYYHYAGDIIYQHFDADGGSMHAKRLAKYQACTFEKGAGSHDATWFTYDKLGISFSSFVSGNSVYVMYQDHQDNYSKKDGSTMYSTITTRAKSCTVLARLDDDGAEMKMVMVPGKTKRTFHNLWLFDGKEIWFGMYCLKDYSLEHSALNDIFSGE
ncbi:MAG: hypothetical protein J5644_09190 [Bacteroidales bacterium]|nr:hypothetical protein [Bacteroidales bacterium]